MTVDMLKNLSAEKHNTFIYIEFGFKKLGENLFFETLFFNSIFFLLIII
jgi:hypothetical protein